MIEGDAQEWLVHADGDLHYARLGQKDADALESLIVFHAQQAIEKALKAVLVGDEVDFPKTHDLEQLVEIIEDAGIAWPAGLNKVLEFTSFATQGRYPGFDDPITEADVEEAIAMAERVLVWAKQQVAGTPVAGS
ncbi:MAG: HEPN domain-containing protein [Verrucomicrobia bacterium]|nr:HEPN domain-containing protein [Verrucomicrobiota bacterium]